jgi:hypothetical protein
MSWQAIARACTAAHALPTPRPVPVAIPTVVVPAVPVVPVVGIG